CFCLDIMYFVCFFFFQAEDGIRDFHVTGVQTCAHPISSGEALLVLLSARDYIQLDRSRMAGERDVSGLSDILPTFRTDHKVYERSEERRVGKEWRCRRWTYDGRKKEKKREKRGRRRARR